MPQNLVPYITQTAAGIRECLSVFGDDYPTPDGSNIRDYIDVVDLAKAHVAAIRRMIEDRNKARYEVFNIGTGRGVSVLELVHRFEQVNRLKLNYKIVGRRAGDIVAIWADPSYANNELGWRALARRDARGSLEMGEAYPRHRIAQYTAQTRKGRIRTGFRPFPVNTLMVFVFTFCAVCCR